MMNNNPMPNMQTRPMQQGGNMSMQPANIPMQQPTNIPLQTGPTYTSGEWTQPIPTNPNMPTSPQSIWDDVPPDQMPPTLMLPIYTPGYLRLHIGDLMRVEFLIGNSINDRVGRLLEVGASFIVLEALDGGSEIVCDIFAIKFVTIIQNPRDAQMLGSFTNY